MTEVIVTTPTGEEHTVTCAGVDASVIDAAYIEQRTGYDVDSVEVIPDTKDRVKQLEQTMGVGGSETDMEKRLDNLERRIEDLEAQLS